MHCCELRRVTLFVTLMNSDKNNAVTVIKQHDLKPFHVGKEEGKKLKKKKQKKRMNEKEKNRDNK